MSSIAKKNISRKTRLKLLEGKKAKKKFKFQKSTKNYFFVYITT